MRRIEKIIKVLNKKYKIEPWRGKPFRVLIGTILSQRTKDEMSWPTSEKLFKVGSNLEKMNKLTEKQIAKIIKPVGFYNQKAKRIKQICKILKEEYKGKVPRTREELEKLPGVGAKTASIVLAYSFGIPTIAVDTHVNRIAQRLGFVPKSYRPEKTQKILEKITPKKLYLIVNNLFISFGKDICKPIRPRCYTCPIVKLCPYEPKNL